MNAGQFYVVNSGDTLGKIAKTHNTSVSELMQLNHLKNPDRIDIGQNILLPKLPASEQVNAADTTDDEWGSLVIQLVDAINRPINGLKVEIEAFGSFFKTETNQNGVLPTVAVKKDNSVKLHVKRAQGGMKHVATITPDGGAQHARIISPKIAVTAALRRHDGPSAPPTAPESRPLGDERSTRSRAGNPVHEVALECPNPQGLRLVANFKYRDIIIAAAKKIELTPQAVAAIINTESAKIPKRYITEPVIDPATGQSKLSKNGKPLIIKSVDPTWHKGEWDTHSASKRSSARGMTQFLDGSWLEIACTNGTYLNVKAKQAGWLTAKAFVLSNGTQVTASGKRSLARVLSGKPYITSRATASDTNLQALLDLRFDPEYIIYTAVEYAKQNMAALSAAGYQLDGLNDGEKAKMAYLGHHLGIGDAKRFIENTITPTCAQYLLEQQIGIKAAKVKASHQNYDYLATHRIWLDKFINDNVDLSDFYCNGIVPPVRTLFTLIEVIKKKA